MKNDCYSKCEHIVVYNNGDDTKRIKFQILSAQVYGLHFILFDHKCFVLQKQIAHLSLEYRTQLKLQEIVGSVN